MNQLNYNLIASIIAAVAALGGAVIVPVTALILNYRGWNSIERRLEIIEADLKQFYKDIYSLKKHTNME